MVTIPQRPRRWTVSAEEMRRMDAARRAPLRPGPVIRLLARAPHLIPEVTRAVARAGRQAVFANNALVSALDGELARQAVPDAASGVGWYEEEPFLAVLLPRLHAEMTVLELGVHVLAAARMCEATGLLVEHRQDDSVARAEASGRVIVVAHA